MTDLLEFVDAVLWLLLALSLLRDLRKWNKRFQELYDELKKEVDDG